MEQKEEQTQSESHEHASTHEHHAPHHHAAHDTPSGSTIPTPVLALCTLAIIIGLLNGIGLYQLHGQVNALEQNLGKAAPTAPSPAGDTPPAVVDMQGIEGDNEVLGAANAPVTIVEWSDYQCPYCGRFYLQTFKQLEEKYIKTGKVRFVYRDFPLSFHPFAQKAAEASECARDQGKFWQYQDKIFVNQAQLSLENLKVWAKDLGLDTKKFDSCLDSGDKAANVQADFNAGQAAGISGTPGFIINGQLLSGAQPFEAFAQVIDQMLAAQ